MTRHAQPRELAELRGSNKAHPERYRGEVPKSDLPLGDAPDRLDPMAAKCWFEISTLCMTGVLTSSDRMMLEMASNLWAEYIEDPRDFSIGKYSHLIGLLARFGMSPADRQKLSIEKPKTDNPFALLNE